MKNIEETDEKEDQQPPEKKYSQDIAHQDELILKYQGQKMSKTSEIAEIKSSEVSDRHTPGLRQSEMLIGDPEVGSESLIRFLKTKVRVLQEDVDRLFQDNHSLMKENSSMEKKIKDVIETKNQIQQALLHEQKRTDNYAKLFEESKIQITGLVTETTVLKKELENSSRVQKQVSSNHSSVEVRLNKALEQVDKYKNQVEKLELRNKETIGKEQKKLEEVMIENRKLQKQKNDLLTGFKKQMLLIDVLKRQKIHLEAANVLQFTEDEFLKLINWKSDQN